MKQKNIGLNKSVKCESGITMKALIIVIIVIIVFLVIFLKSTINKVFTGAQNKVDDMNREINNKPQQVYDNTLKDLEIDKYLN